MTPIIEIFIGILIGCAVAGIALFCYMLLRSIKDLTNVLAPLVNNQDLIRGLQSFSVLIETGKEIGTKMDALHQVIGLFYQMAVSRPNVMTAQETPADGGLVSGYNEIDAAARAAAEAAKREAFAETSESHISTPRPSTDVF